MPRNFLELRWVLYVAIIDWLLHSVSLLVHRVICVGESIAEWDLRHYVDLLAQLRYHSICILGVLWIEDWKSILLHGEAEDQLR